MDFNQIPPGYPSPSEEQLAEWVNLPLSEEERLLAAGRWFADQELRACWQHLATEFPFGGAREADKLFEARRGTLNRQDVINDFEALMSELDGAGNYSNCADRIRRALKNLPEEFR